MNLTYLLKQTQSFIIYQFILLLDEVFTFLTFIRCPVFLLSIQTWYLPQTLHVSNLHKLIEKLL